MSTIDVEIEQTPYNPCAIRFRPGKHWLARLSNGRSKLEWFMDGEARPTADEVVLSIEQAVAVARVHLDLESFAKATKLPLASTSDRAQVAQTHAYLLFAGSRWDALQAPDASRPQTAPGATKPVPAPPPPPAAPKAPQTLPEAVRPPAGFPAPPASPKIPLGW